MDTVTRTFPISLTSSYAPSSIIELSHFRDMTFDADERVAVYLESFFCNLNLKSFNLGVIPNFDGDESEAEKMAKFSAAEAKSQKIGLRLLARKNNIGDWLERAEIILINRGRKDYFDLLQPYLAKNQVRILEKNDALAIQLVDYGNGLLTSIDSLGIEAAFTITIAKKNSLEAFEARLASLELALKDRLTQLNSGFLLGRNSEGIGAVESIPQSTFTTPVQVQTKIDSSILAIIEGAPGTLNTLDELAAAINDNANFGVAMTDLIATKASQNVTMQLTPRSNTTAGAFDANNWVMLFFAGCKWLDGGVTNLNLPPGLNTGVIIQFDPLFIYTVTGKYLTQIFFSGNRLFFRIQNNSVWNAWREVPTVAV